MSLSLGHYRRPYRRIVHSYHRPVYRNYYHHRPYYYRRYYSDVWVGGSFIVTEPIPPVIINQVNVRRPRVVVEQTSIHMSKQEKLTDTLLHGTRTERRGAAEDLSEYNNIASVAVLVDALFNDGSAKVRAQAAQSLGEIGDPRSYDALVRSSESDEEDDVRAEAEEAAEKIQDKVGDDELYISQPRPSLNEDVDKLVVYLEDLRYGGAEIREHAAEKLSKFHSTQAVAALIDTMVNDANKEVREEAAESLGKIGDRMALPFLKSARYNDSNESVRKDAEKSMDRIYDTIQ